MLPSGGEWLIVLLVIMIIFGAGKLPSVLKSMGQGVREFKKASSEEPEETEKNSTNDEKPASNQG